MRLADESAYIRDCFPAEYVDVALVVTEFGGTTVPMVLLATLYWVAYRRETALVISYALCGVSLVLILKTLFGLPRPPESVFLAPIDVDEYGFPSGHAFASVVVYGGLVSAYGWTDDRKALLTVGTLIAAVSLSRIVLGVHYLGDVIAGLTIGLGFLWCVSKAVDGEPRTGFALAAVTGFVSLVIVGVTDYTVLAFGGAVGGLVGTYEIDSIPPIRSWLDVLGLVAAGVVFLLVSFSARSMVADSPVGQSLFYAVFVFVILALPAVSRFGFAREMR